MSKTDIINQILENIEKSEFLLRKIGVRVPEPMIFKSLHATREMLEGKPPSALAAILRSTSTCFVSLKSLSAIRE